MATPHEELHLLAVFHYVLAGLEGLFALFPVLHLAFGIAMVTGAFGHGHQPPPEWMGWLFIGLGSAFIAMGLTGAALTAYAGRSLAARKRHTFCLVMAALNCLFAPFGTVLGVFTIVVLLKPEVKVLFGLPPPAWPTQPWGPPPGPPTGPSAGPAT